MKKPESDVHTTGSRTADLNRPTRAADVTATLDVEANRGENVGTSRSQGDDRLFEVGDLQAHGSHSLHDLATAGSEPLAAKQDVSTSGDWPGRRRRRLKTAKRQTGHTSVDGAAGMRENNLRTKVADQTNARPCAKSGDYSFKA